VTAVNVTDISVDDNVTIDDNDTMFTINNMITSDKMKYMYHLHVTYRTTAEDAVTIKHN
jgi:hypothetical protein